MAAMSDAYKILPELSKKQKEDWVTDELMNLSKKKKMLGFSSMVFIKNEIMNKFKKERMKNSESNNVKDV